MDELSGINRTFSLGPLALSLSPWGEHGELGAILRIFKLF